ncbi:MAG: hypothetical protein LM588_06175 [Fervidicoccaceae archaeon]|nr:hypothetical protein [Fervidicoccaceae archaeon]
MSFLLAPRSPLKPALIEIIGKDPCVIHLGILWDTRHTVNNARFYILESSRRPWQTRFLLGFVISLSIATVTASVISFLFSTLPGKLLIHAVIFILALTGFYFIISWQSNTRKIEEVAVSKIFFYTSDGRIVEFTTECLAF